MLRQWHIQNINGYISWPSMIYQEVKITYRLLYGNWIHFMVSYYLSLIPRLFLQPVQPWKIAELLILCLPFSIITAYQFEITNQATSPTEDRLNKPYRPIPAGLLTIPQARFRWLLSWTMTPYFLYRYFGPEAGAWSCLAQAYTGFFYAWPAYNHFACRNIFAGGISFPLYRNFNVVFSTSVPELHLSFWVDITLWFWLLCTIHLQEYRDIEGDRRSNRQTIPVVLSACGNRAVLVGTACFIFGFSSLLLIWSLNFIEFHQTVTWTALVHFVASASVAVRLVSSHGDTISKATYHYLYYVGFWTLVIHLVTVSFSWDDIVWKGKI